MTPTYNKLILIGNGFDLAHGLKTKYSDFIVWLLNKEIAEVAFKLSYESDLLKIDNPVQSKFPEISSIKEYQNFLKIHHIKIKIKSLFFEDLLKQLNDYNWVDIETEYYLALVNLYKLLEKANLTRQPSISKDVQNLNNSFDYLKKKLEEYLITIDFGINKKDEEINNHFIDDILKDLIVKEGIITNKCKVLFLVFNYTKTLELYLKNTIIDRHCKTIYIHGKLNDEANPIIFGYGDEMDNYYAKIEGLNDKAFLKNFKRFAYFNTTHYQNLIEFIDYDKFNVYIMGHSCGISDRVLLNSIFRHNNCKSIKIYYHQKSQKIDDFIDKTQEISRHFTAEEKTKMSRLIVAKPNCEPLKKHKR